ncbi:hypothetical protein BJ508DRAFT_364470 [Ascobolus immersus RN42]|uniref:Uncharacterized protein n=1 Tax=Ascobolus immersus RN42 TaxID=1160509 RepID=A0A3N4HZT3_ASCIM|nr:hypothetical protein BJ508DRAFT_364470 [Ascobolus immersus RN42]
MHLLAILAIASTVCSAFPNVAPNKATAHHLARRFVSIQSNEELDILRPLTEVSKGPITFSTTHQLLPSYPKSITNPVDPNSWLMQYARSPKLVPYWNFTETLWSPCQRHGHPLPDPADIHSHTHLGIFTGECNMWAQICTFATFVLPDSACPGRVNSYNLRCPHLLEDLNKIMFDKKPYWAAPLPVHPNEPVSYLTDGIEKGTLLTPANCQNPNERPESQLPPPAFRTSTTTTETATASTSTPTTLLLKRDYQYRKYLDSKYLYRTYGIEGPRTPIPFLPYGINRPFNCYDAETMVQAERINLPGIGQPEICYYPMGTKDIAEERCPGIKSPEDCPGSDEEMVDAIVEYAVRTKWEKLKDRETVRGIVEGLKREEKAYCDETKEYCVGPEEGKNGGAATGVVS